MVHLDGIRRHFGPQMLFEDLSWMVSPLARVGLVGPNGAGKTTLLRILAGTDQPDGGVVRKPDSLRIGFLPQEVETVGDGSVLAIALGGLGELKDMEIQLEDLEGKMASLDPEDPALEKATSAYGELRERFEILGGDRAEARAVAILTGLGVAQTSFHRSVRLLSGGWRMRVALARLLLGEPDLLLLDEPTNHLDLEALGWLEGFLDSYQGAYVVVSHDRYFLNRMVRGIAELDHGRLTVFHGNYDEYLVTKESQEAAREKAARHREKEVARVERFIERFRYKASKARQVQSRIRTLDRVTPLEAPARRSRGIRFGFPKAPRSGDIVIRAERVSKSFGEKVVFTGMDLLLRRGDRVALVGPNGVGKSTLLKLLGGVLNPDGGNLEIGHKVVIKYYAQHLLEALDPAMTVLESVEKVAGPAERLRLRKLLGGFLFSGDDAEKKVEVLSGGEKARLALARLLLEPANLLLLDEPTNHLDLRSREVLEEALNEHEGTMVLVTHDRYFINRVASSIAEVGNGRVELFHGDYDSFLERERQRRAPSEKGEEPLPDEKKRGRTRRREVKRADAEERNRRYKERRAAQVELEPIEAKIAILEERVKQLTKLQTDPEIYQDEDKAAEIGREKAGAEERLRELYAQWESLADQFQSE